MRRAVLAVWALVVTGGCLQKIIKPPVEGWVTVGGKRASYRDWTRSDICLVDPKYLQGDLDSLNALLAEFLGQTSAGPEGMWADEHIALLEEGQKQLPQVLDVEAANLAHAKGAACKTEGLTKAQELNSQAKKRLAEASEVLSQVKGHRAVNGWKEAQPAAIAAAKEKCPVKPKAGAKPEVFYASEDDVSQAQWLFCDGARVAAAPGQAPAYVAPEAAPAKGAKKVKPQDYLDAAAKFEPGGISRAPHMPSKVTARKDDGQPEPSDAP